MDIWNIWVLRFPPQPESWVLGEANLRLWPDTDEERSGPLVLEEDGSNAGSNFHCTLCLSLYMNSKLCLNLIRCVASCDHSAVYVTWKTSRLLKKTILHQEKHGGWIMIEFSYFALMPQRLQRDISITLFWRPLFQAIICCHLDSFTQDTSLPKSPLKDGSFVRDDCFHNTRFCLCSQYSFSLS